MKGCLVLIIGVIVGILGFAVGIAAAEMPWWLRIAFVVIGIIVFFIAFTIWVSTGNDNYSGWGGSRGGRSGGGRRGGR